MANGTNIAASKNRRCETFNIYMDEFLGVEITISIQWDHKKAMHVENLTSHISSSWNAKILGPMRDTHSVEKQDNPTRMYDGLQTGSTAFQSEHRLNMHEGCSPVRQKKRGQAPERNKAIQEEVEKLVDTGIMKGVHYHSWLSNQVMVKKHDDSWRMCMDFKDVNKACLKDGYLLPEIDWKNSRATYQRLVDKAFQKQIGRNFEINPRKCTCGIEEGMFLGYKENTKGIKILFTDGSSCVDGFGAGLILMNPKGTKFTYALRFRFDAINNEAEDEALIADIRIAKNGCKKSPDKRGLPFSGQSGPKEVKNASTSFAHLTKQVLVEELSQKSINEAKVLAVVEEERDTWMTPIHNYLTEEALLAEKEKERVVRR
nr:hypothetical protein [Tanacetum cinerariifolium]